MKVTGVNFFLKHSVHFLVVPWRQPAGLQCLHCTGPSYLTDLCIPVSVTTTPVYILSTCADLMIPSTWLSRYTSSSFAVCGPAAWNSLTAAVRDNPHHYPVSAAISELNYEALIHHTRDSLTMRIGKQKNYLTYLLKALKRIKPAATNRLGRLELWK